MLKAEEKLATMNISPLKLLLLRQQTGKPLHFSSSKEMETLNDFINIYRLSIVNHNYAYLLIDDTSKYVQNYYQKQFFHTNINFKNTQTGGKTKSQQSQQNELC